MSHEIDPDNDGTCRNCGKPLGVRPSAAKHKIFCSKGCRQDWHQERAKKGRELLREVEQDGWKNER